MKNWLLQMACTVYYDESYHLNIVINRCNLYTKNTMQLLYHAKKKYKEGHKESKLVKSMVAHCYQPKIIIF